VFRIDRRRSGGQGLKVSKNNIDWEIVAMSLSKMHGCLMAVVGVALALPASAEDVAEFYKGKRLTVYIGSSTGGGTDIYGRTVAQFLGNLVPGKPAIVVSNMPGANGMNLA